LIETPINITIYAVCKALENMGETTESIRKKFLQVPFKQMAGLRDIVTHNYDGISYNMIWEVIRKELPSLEGQLYPILSEDF
jgi:uncharacterized protein with HEPN domain